MDLKLSDLLYCHYEKGGCGPHGYDCWGLCREVYRRAGRNLPVYSDYLTRLDVASVICKVRDESGDFIEIPKPEYLAIILLMLGRNLHTGIVLEDGKFIHVMKNLNVSIERLDSLRFRQRIRGYYRYVADNQA